MVANEKHLESFELCRWSVSFIPNKGQEIVRFNDNEHSSMNELYKENSFSYTYQSNNFLSKTDFKDCDKSNFCIVTVHHKTSPIFKMRGEEILISDSSNNNSNLEDEAFKEKSGKKSVRFSHLEIREYNLTLGDHPDCKSGPPVSLGSDYVDLEKIDVATYENEMASSRRKGESLRMSLTMRELILKDAGFSRDEVYKAIFNARKVKRDRILSKDFARLHEFTLSASTALKSTARFISKTISLRQKEKPH